MLKYLSISIFIILLLTGCPCSDDDWIDGSAYFITFEEVSQPYLDTYGPPEDVYDYYSVDYHSISWWWWSQGFEVTFLLTSYDDICGWTVDSEYSFPPI